MNNAIKNATWKIRTTTAISTEKATKIESTSIPVYNSTWNVAFIAIMDVINQVMIDE